MKFNLKIWAAAAGALAFAGSAYASELTITTGSDTGTYRKFGDNIKLIADNIGISLDVKTSRGSVENLRRLLGYEGASDGEFYQLALVQADVLQELREQAKDNDILEDIVGKIRVVMPLYGEEVHVFAPLESPYRDFNEVVEKALLLGGGKTKSGTLHTSTALVRLLGNGGSEIQILPVGGDNALSSVRTGEVEAFVDVSGAPSTFASGIEAGDNVQLLPIRAGEKFDDPNSPYRTVILPPSVYPWMTAEIETVAVNSLLVAYAYDERNEHCATIEKLTRAIVKSIDFLRREGHPKWHDFSLRAARERTDLYDCARRGLFDE